MVQKYRRQIQSSSIGVIKADMSVANDLGQTANIFSNLSNQAFQIAGRKAQEKGREYISSLEDDEIFGLDENNKPVNLVDNLVSALPAKGYGMASQDVIKTELRNRFSSIVSQKLEKQGATYTAMFPNNPKKFEEQMGEFVNELALPYGGEYKALINSQAQKYVSGVAARLQINMINNQTRLSNLNLKERLAKESSSLIQLAAGASHDTVMSLLDSTKQTSIDNDDNHKQNKSGLANSRNLRGGFEISPDSYTENLKGEMAAAQFSRQIGKLMSGTAADRTTAAMIQTQLLNGGSITMSPEDAPDGVIKKLNELLPYIKASPKGLATLKDNITQQFIAGNRVQSYLNQSIDSQMAAGIDALDKNVMELNTQIESLMNPNSALHRQYVGELAKHLQSGDYESFFGTIGDVRTFLDNGVNRLQGTAAGKRIESTSRVLQSGRRDTIMGFMTQQAVQVAKEHMLGKFSTSTGYDVAKLRALDNALNNPNQAGKFATEAGFTPEQIRVLDSLKQFRTKAVGPAGQETDFVAGMSVKFRANLSTAIGEAITAHNAYQTQVKKELKYTNIVTQIRNGKQILSDDNEIPDILNKVLMKEFQMTEEQLLKAMTTSEFLPGTPLFNAVSQMMLVNGKIPKAIETITDKLLETGDAPQGDYRGIEQIWRQSEQPHLVYERNNEGEPIVKGVEVSRLTGLIDNKKLNLVRDILKVQAQEGGSIFGIAKQLAAFKNNPDGYNQMLNNMFPNDDDGTRETSLFNAIAAIPEVASSGGKGSPFYNHLVSSAPFWLYRNRNKAGFTGDQDDLNAWGKALMEEVYPPTEDFVIDVFGFGQNLGSENYRSTFALARLLPNPEMKKLFLQYAEEKIKRFGNYSLVDQSADRGELEGDQSGGFFDFLTADKAGTNTRKVWLAPDHASSNAPFLNLANGLPPGRDIFFTFVTGDSGDVKYMIGGDEQNKDLIRLSMKEFFNYAASIGAFGNMIEP